MSLRLRLGARSDVGLVREHNEDSLYAGHRLLAVADGIGGAVAGEVASSLTIQALRPLDDPGEVRDVLAALRQAVRSANAALHERIERQPELAGMGTTLTAMLWSDERLGLAHVGDSRGYLRRDGVVSQITRDQTFVQMLVDDGRITAEQATTHPQRSVILNALDGREEVEPDLTMRDPLAGDRYLLCSDGLSDYVESAALADALGDVDPQRACDRLVGLALDAGAPDNVTVLVADVLTDEPTAAPGDTVVIARPDDRLPIVAGAAGEMLAGGDHPPDSGQRQESTTSRTEERVKHRSLRRRLAVVVAVVVVLIAAAVVGTGVWIHSRWYVAATTATGTVGVYQGVSGSALGHPLSHLKSPTDVPVTSLPQDDADRVRNGIDESSRAKADALVTTLRQDSCAQAEAASNSRLPLKTRRGLHPAPTLPTWCTQ